MRKKKKKKDDYMPNVRVFDVWIDGELYEAVAFKKIGKKK